MSSAAMVSLRMRLSANARSSAIDGSRWWHTISMSRCSSMVLLVNGRVGLVEDGSTFFRPATLMMSGAWPPPAPSVWKAWMVRPLKALMVSSTKPLSFSVSVWIITCTSYLSATDRQQSIAAGVVPQSSCSLSAQAPALTISSSAAGPRGIALAGKAEIDRKRIGRLDHAAEMPRPRRAGGGIGAGRRPGAAAEHRGDAGHQRLVDLLRADEMDVGVEAAGGEDFSLAGDDLGAGADDDGDAGLDVGIAGLADGGDAAVLEADVGLDDAPVIEDQRVGDDGVDRALPVGDLRLPHAVADHLAAAELHLLAIDGEILFDLDDEIGVGEPHAVAGGRPEHVGIGRAFHGDRHNLIPAVHQPPKNPLLPHPRRRIGLPPGHPSSAHAGHG